MKNKLKRLIAVLLTSATVLSMLPANAWAAEGPGAEPPAETAAPTPTPIPSSGPIEGTVNARDPINGKPNLYVHFLGDNIGHNDLGAGFGSNGTKPGTYSPGLVQQPTSKNWYTGDTTENPGKWHYYTQEDYDNHSSGTDEVIFWVGVGMDRLDVYDLFRQSDDGLYSLELGFYYNTQYVEPYVHNTYTSEADGGYLKTLQMANLRQSPGEDWSNSAHVWDEDYEIITAEMDLEPQTDWVTQEVLDRSYASTESSPDRTRNPGMEEIMGAGLDEGATNPWKMTYVALECENPEKLLQRFNGAYSEEKAAEYEAYAADQALDTPTGDAEKPEDKAPEYFLLIPFRLKGYDPARRLCIRLARNAHLFSMGAGENDGGLDGADAYAAWDRVTTRNENADIKLMSNFAGDLNIFTGRNEEEDPLSATLEIIRGGSVSNTADLHITNDPGPVKVHVNTTGEIIGGLYGGTGMEVKVNCATGFDVKVEVFKLFTQDPPATPEYVPVDIIKDKDTYRFVMPEYDVYVRVTFTIKDGVTDYRIILDEDRSKVTVPNDEKGDPMPAVVGNKTTITAIQTVDPNKDAANDPTALGSKSIDSDTNDPSSLVALASGAYNAPNNKTLPFIMARAQNVKGLNDSDRVPVDPVKISVETHADYDAIVTIYNSLDKTLSATGTFRSTNPVPNDNLDTTADPAAYCSIYLENGGEITFDMPSNDLIVDVRYVPAETRTAYLEVHHANGLNAGQVLKENVAQLEFDYYKVDNKPYRTFSGVVYHTVGDDGTANTLDDVHNNVEAPFRELLPTDKSSAVGSGSYAGDGIAAQNWSNVMQAAYQAASGGMLDDMLKTLSPRDLRGGDGVTAPTDDQAILYRNLRGDYYTDSSFADFQNAFKALVTEIMGNKATYPDYVDETAVVTPPGGGAAVPDPTQYYLNISWKQMQLFLLAYDGANLTDAIRAMEGDAGGGDAPNSPAAVKRAYDALKWEGRGTQTYQDKSYIVTRQGRTVSVLLESDNRYIADISVWSKADPSVELTPTVGGVTVTQHGDYQNVYSFTMPQQDCIVKVTYRLRTAPRLSLQFSGIILPKENTGTAAGYGPDTTGSLYPNPVVLTKPTVTANNTTVQSSETVFAGTTVTVTVGVGSAYRLSANVTTASGSVTTVPVSVTSLNDKDVFTFIMPTDDTTVTLTYSNPPAVQSKATIFTQYRDTSPTSPNNTGYWENTNPKNYVRYNVPEGEHMVAEVHVEPGYYVYASWAQTASGQPIPYVASGNGYNSGSGGDVTVSCTMPGEDLEVYVVFAYGEPPEEPHNALQLRTDHVSDPVMDNQAQIYSISDPGDYQGKKDAGRWIIDDELTPTGDLLTNYRTFVPAGREVVVAVKKPAAGYFVSKVEITPSNMGVDVNWIAKPASATDPVYEDAKFLQFTSPGGPIVVTVFFEKEDADHPEKGTYFLNVDKSEWDAASDRFVVSNNHIPHVYSDLLEKTLGSGAGGSYVSGTGYAVPSDLPQWIPTNYGSANAMGVARPGDEVTLKIRIQPGWYIDAITINSTYGNAPYTLSDWNNKDGAAPLDVEAKFFMPSADTYVVVHFRNDDVDRTAHRLGLRVRDPDNTGEPKADNWALLTVEHLSDGTTSTLGKYGLGDSAQKDANNQPISTGRTYNAKFGDTVTLTFDEAAGYYLDYIRMGPAGSTVVPVYVDPHTVQFTMPDSSVEVEVCFRKGTERPQYTADLILRPPTGTNPVTGKPYTIADAGAGSFVTKDGAAITWTVPDPSDPTGVATLTHTAGLADPIYSMVGIPGNEFGYTAKANDGFYIKRVTVTPASTGVVPTLTGSFGVQGGVFRMPPAHVYVNVWFEVGWPDTAQFDLTVKVTDPSFNGTTDPAVNNNAYLDNVNYTDWTPKTHVYGGQQATHFQAAKDQELVRVAIDKKEGHRVASITVKTANGVDVPWYYAPGGIKFYMPAEAVTVHVTFEENPAPDVPDPGPGPYPPPSGDLHKLTLVVTDNTTGANNTATVTDGAGSDLTQTGTGTTSRTNVPVGTSFLITATPDANVRVGVVYALDAGGNLLTDPVTATLDTNGVCTDSFAMPASDATVYVTFVDNTTPPGVNDRQGILQVTGPAGAGSAIMVAKDSAGVQQAATSRVDASGMDGLYAEIGSTMEVDITIHNTYLLKALRVVELGSGKSVPYIWTGNGTQISFTMPGSGVLVKVDLEKQPDAPRTYTVQLVVNDTTNPATDPTKRSSAGLGLAENAVWDSSIPDVAYTAATRVDYISGVNGGQEIFLGLHVAPGYTIESVVVVSQSHGIHPALAGNSVSQATSFHMPADDIVVYVKFGSDGRQRYNAILDVTGCDDVTDYNRGSIYSDYSGLAGPIVSIDPTVSVRAAAEYQNAGSGTWYPGEWVTVKYGNHPDLIANATTGEGGLKPGYIVDSVTVTAAGVVVPFTQVNEWEIRFPMVEAQVNVIVRYAEGTERKGEKVVLHLIDETGNDTVLTGETDNWAQLLWRGSVSTLPPQPVNPPAVGVNATQKLNLITGTNTPEVTDDTLRVPAGELVDVECFAGTGLYIRGAFVMLEETHQMIQCNLPADNDPTKNFTGEYSAAAAPTHDKTQFMVHPGTNHVYVYVTDKKPDPNETRYSAVLTLTGPGEDTTSHAILSSAQQPPDNSATAKVNQGHAYITVLEGKTVTVQVNPTSGYEIDFIRFSPLDIDKRSDINYTVIPGSGGNTFTFEMPGENIAIHVHLRSGAARKYDLTFHVMENPVDGNEGRVSFVGSTGTVYTHYKHTGTGNDYTKNETSGTSTAGNVLNVPEGTTVTLDGWINPDNYILHAFALQSSATSSVVSMVPMADVLEGITDSHPADASVKDASTSFTMPGANVDVYLVYTKTKPKDGWYTAVLIATDTRTDGSLTITNSGLNQGDFNLTPVDPGNGNGVKDKTVWSFGQKAPDAASIAAGRDQSVYYTVAYPGDAVTVDQIIANTDYQFDPPATISSGTTGATPTLSTLGTGVGSYAYSYNVGNSNTAVQIHFVGSTGSRQSNLTVRIIDADNPSNGTIDNTVVTSPGTIAPLTLHSTTSSGAAQFIPNVNEGDVVRFTATPDPAWAVPAGYQVMAKYSYDSGTGGEVTSNVALTANGSGGYDGQFAMPGAATTLTVYFYKPYEATLELRDLQGGLITATDKWPAMTEGAFGGSIQVNSTAPSASLPNLPNATQLTATVPDLTGVAQLVGVLLTTDSGTTLMTAEADGVTYLHTIDRSDAKVTVIVDQETVAPPDDPTRSYVAAVNMIAPPAGATADIANATNASAVNGDIWTKAASGDMVELKLNVPVGYTATVTSTNGVVTTTSVVGTGADQTETFAMPAHNVQITITYTRTSFDLKLVLDAPAATGSRAEIDAAVVDNGTRVQVISNVTPGEDKAVNVTVGAGEYLWYVVQTNADGTVVNLTPAGAADPYGFAVPDPGQDSTVTVVIRDTAPPGPGPGPGPNGPYIVNIIEAGPAKDVPGNEVLRVDDLTGVISPSPAGLWALANAGDDILGSYTTAPGYYASVTAVRTGTSTPVPLVQQDIGPNGTGRLTMPAADVTIIVTYKTLPDPDDPNPPDPVPEYDVSFRIVGHGGVADNTARLYESAVPTGVPLEVLDGSMDPTGADITTNVGTVAAGAPLSVAAEWATTPERYNVVRVTLTVNGLEVDVPFNPYEPTATATSVFSMPNADVLVTVYYEKVYTLTLSVSDTTPSQDGSATTEGYITAVPEVITDTAATTDPTIVGFLGDQGEKVSTVVTVPSDGKLLGVVRTGRKTGALDVPLTAGGTAPVAGGAAGGPYDFVMPKCDTTVTPVIVDKDGPFKDALIARVAIDPDSEGLGLAANDADIANLGSYTTLPPSGKYWTVANPNDTVEITVHLAPGYQAQVTAIDPNHLYVNRHVFLNDGETARFTMPSVDAQVTIKFIEGYTATLVLTDTTGAANTATMTGTPKDGSSTTVTGASDPTGGVTYTGGAVKKHMDHDSINHLEAGAAIDGTTTSNGLDSTATPAQAPRVVRSTVMTGSMSVPVTGGSYAGNIPGSTIPPTAPGEDAEFHVILDNRPLLAKVELRGKTGVETAITGNNGAAISNSTDTTAPTGTIWVTATGDDGIHVDFTIAKGYRAEVKIRKDDAAMGSETYLDAADTHYSYNIQKDGGTAETIGDTFGYSFDSARLVGNTGGNVCQHTLDFKIAGAETDVSPYTGVTVIIEYSFAGAIPAPHDPDNQAEGDWKLGYIYGENRSGYAIIDVPTLFDGADYFDADDADEDAAVPGNTSEYVKYKFFIKKDGKYLELVEGTDVILTYVVDDASKRGPYDYNYDDRTYDTSGSGWSRDDDNGTATRTAARFRLSLKEQTPTSVQAQAFAAILNNSGTTGTGAGGSGDEPPTELYIVAQNSFMEVSDYVQVKINPVVTIQGTFASWGPTHAARVSLYPIDRDLVDTNGTVIDPGKEMLASSYPTTKITGTYPNAKVEDLAVTFTEVKDEWGTDYWEQDFAVGSSELLELEYEDGTPMKIFMLVIEKPGHVTYQRVNLDLSGVDANTDNAAKYYVAAEKAFTIQGPDMTQEDGKRIVELTPGDLDGDGEVNNYDQFRLSDFLEHKLPWTTETDDTLPDWDTSIYNPQYEAYWADLDGDGDITGADLALLSSYSPSNYRWNYFGRRANTDIVYDYWDETKWVAPNGFDWFDKDVVVTAAFARMFAMRAAPEYAPFLADLYPEVGEEELAVRSEQVRALFLEGVLPMNYLRELQLLKEYLDSLPPVEETPVEGELPEGELPEGQLPEGQLPEEQPPESELPEEPLPPEEPPTEEEPPALPPVPPVTEPEEGEGEGSEGSGDGDGDGDGDGNGGEDGEEPDPDPDPDPDLKPDPEEPEAEPDPMPEVDPDQETDPEPEEAEETVPQPLPEPVHGAVRRETLEEEEYTD